LALEIVKRIDDVKGFKALPKRWVVERTFGWMKRYCFYYLTLWKILSY